MTGTDLLIGFAVFVGIMLIAVALITVFGGAMTSLGWWVRKRVEIALGQRQ